LLKRAASRLVVRDEAAVDDVAERDWGMERVVMAEMSMVEGYEAVVGGAVRGATPRSCLWMGS
jgi:hypothetical protein